MPLHTPMREHEPDPDHNREQGQQPDPEQATLEALTQHLTLASLSAYGLTLESALREVRERIAGELGERHAGMAATFMALNERALQGDQVSWAHDAFPTLLEYVEHAAEVTETIDTLTEYMGEYVGTVRRIVETLGAAMEHPGGALAAWADALPVQ